MEDILPSNRQRDDVIHFHQISITKVQPAFPTRPLLFLQELAHSSRHIRVTTQPSAPVNPVTIIKTAITLHLDMSPDRSLVVSRQLKLSAGSLKRPGLFSGEVPILVRDPCLAFVRMAARSPGQQHGEEQMV